MMTFDDQEDVRPDGLAVRRRRHEHGWSARDLVEAIADACERATGTRKTITPNLLKSVEEHGEVIPYGTLCLIADGLGCDPIDIIPIPDPDEEDEYVN